MDRRPRATDAGTWAGSWVPWALATLMALGGLGCRTRTAPPAPPVSDEGRMPHAAHSAMTCTDCHELDAVLSGGIARPGRREHAPCDQAPCHREAFLAAPGRLCSVCHQEVAATAAGGSPLVPYPPRQGRRALASSFSHARHLDFAVMEAQVGFHVSCVDCHTASPDDAATVALPGHDVCGRCHAPEAAPSGVPVMNQCRACHQQRAEQPLRRRHVIVGDLRFGHDDHNFDRRGDPIACTACHTDSADASVAGAHPSPHTSACVVCHDDRKRTPSLLGMQVCQACHSRPRRLLGALPPRSHLPARERPEDHTLAFRRDHGAEAEADAGRCARCHTFMSGSPDAVCDECHQSMRPMDHVLTWREFDHGPAAATRSDRCATCHSAPFCWSCHSVRPRSHVPVADWRCGGHAVPASVNLRACLTCHDSEQSCLSCHQGGAPQCP
ncbi:hypothetical protein [Haliangium sp.]|uniref:hypothetical protein n=1 Tax=Haliangium sp. TaxID=2663208 RepID=UPI003D13FA56